MRNVVFVLITIVLTATMCPPPPYRTRNIYKENKSDSNRINFQNGLQMTIRYSSLDWNSHSIGVAIICDLQNPTPDIQLLNRKNFSAISSRGIRFKELPMQTADETGLWFKLYTLPDSLPVAPQQEMDYVFIFQSVMKYSKKEASDYLQSDTLFFQYDGKHTLCKIVGDDSRINRF